MLVCRSSGFLISLAFCVRCAETGRRYWYGNDQADGYSSRNGNGSLSVMLRCEEAWVLEGSQCCQRCELKLRGYGDCWPIDSPPTTVSCAPRRMALGSKLLILSALRCLCFLSNNQ